MVSRHLSFVVAAHCAAASATPAGRLQASALSHATYRCPHIRCFKFNISDVRMAPLSHTKILPGP